MDKISEKARHPAVAGVLEFFESGHLPAGIIRDTAQEFAEMAEWAADNLPSIPMLTTALNKLLEAKDAAVRCAVHAERAARGVGTIVNPSEFAKPVDPPMG